MIMTYEVQDKLGVQLSFSTGTIMDTISMSWNFNTIVMPSRWVLAPEVPGPHAK